MAEEHHHEEPKQESLFEKISEKIHGDHDSSSSDSDDEKKKSSSSSSSSPSPMKSNNYRLFGRDKPVHNVFGGGKRMLKNSSFL